MSRAFFGSFLLVASFIACAGSVKPVESPPAPSEPIAPEPTSSGPNDPVPTVKLPEPTDDAGAPKLCGCALCKPVLSEDPCSADTDCAPATPCHAEVCVAKAKAKPITPATVCTMDFRCASIDANRCACIDNHYALAPK